MKYVKEQLPTTMAFSASNPSTLTIGARSYWITAMEIAYVANYNTGLSPAGRQDSLYRAITALSLIGGGRPYLRIASPDARALYWGVRLRNRGRFRVPDYAFTASQTGLILTHNLPIVFGVNPVRTDDGINWFDTTAAIKPDVDLTLQVNWGVAGTTTTTTIQGVNVAMQTSTILRVTLYGIIPEAGDPLPSMYPLWNSSQWSPTQTYAGLSGTVDLNAGYYFRRSNLVFLNGASPVDNRTNGANSNAISEIGVKTADGRFPLNMKTIDFVQMSQSQFMVADDNGFSSDSGALGTTISYGAASAANPYNSGVGAVDWAELANTRDPNVADPLYGLNMVNKLSGAAKFAFTVDASTNTSVLFLHEAYGRY